MIHYICIHTRTKQFVVKHWQGWWMMSCFANGPEIGCKVVSARSAAQDGWHQLYPPWQNYLHQCSLVVVLVILWINVLYNDWTMMHHEKCECLIFLRPDFFGFLANAQKWTIFSQMSKDDSSTCSIMIYSSLMCREGQRSSATGPTGRRDGAPWLGKSHTAATAGPCGFPSGGLHFYPIASSGALAEAEA